jgi:hypothetical protein
LKSPNAEPASGWLVAKKHGLGGISALALLSLLCALANASFKVHRGRHRHSDSISL